MNELILLCMEMVGTVAFALSGAMTALRRQMDLLGVMILGLITAVGGGVLRDSLAGNVPYIFRKHIYALAALAGAAVWVVCHLYWNDTAALLMGSTVVVAIRLLAAHFRWSLPKAKVPEG